MVISLQLILLCCACRQLAALRLPARDHGHAHANSKPECGCPKLLSGQRSGKRRAQLLSVCESLREFRVVSEMRDRTKHQRSPGKR
jgi:hypothetical protein